MIWNEKFETMNPEEMKKHQSEALIKLVERVYNKNAFYKKKMDDANVKPSDIKSIDDILKLPFTTKDEMRDVYPLGLLSTEIENIVEIHTSSGTTGKPVVDAYTDKDLEIWSEGMARTAMTDSSPCTSCSSCRMSRMTESPHS